MNPSSGAYRQWQDLWEAMMRQYCPGRESLFGLVLEILGATLVGPEISILDLGAGSGVFTQRVLDRFPHARVTAVDRSPNSLFIARSLVNSDRAAWVDADLMEPDSAVPPGVFDAAFLGWVTHELPAWRLPGLYAEIAGCLRPGGLLLNADFMTGLPPGFQELAFRLTTARVTGEWREFSAELEQQEPLKTLARQEEGPRTRWIVHHRRPAHLRALQAAGFAATAEVWRYLNSSLILAVKGAAGEDAR